MSARDPKNPPDPAEREGAASVDPGAEGAAPGEGLAGRADELEALLAVRDEETRDWRDKFLRARADLENFRRRAAREQGERAAQAAAETVAPLLEIVDDLERALCDSAGDAGPLASGVRLIRDKIDRILAELGVTAIDVAGARFDPSVHEAFGGVRTADAEPDTILQEIRRGYRIGDRVLRPARVVVALPVGESAPGAASDATDG